MARKIIIDTDPGIDDAMAIFFAFKSKDLDVLGLTTVFGNVSVEQATKNALLLTDLAGEAVPVAKGAATPLVISPNGFPDFVHGEDGFGNIQWPESKGTEADVSAAQFMVDSVRQHPKQVTLVALGPLTNLALALEIEPDLPNLVDEVILMGGAVKETGNVSPVAEANIFNDPHAADKVFTAGWPVTMIGLDVTHRVVLSADVLKRIQQKQPVFGDFLFQASSFYIDFYQSRFPDLPGCYFHDAATIACAISPALFGVEKGAIRVVYDGIAIGQTMFAPEHRSFEGEHWQGIPMSRVAMSVDAKRVLDLFEKTLS